jgi:hypothetical protein
MEVVNSVFRQYFEHKWAYDFATLEFLLGRYDFCEIQQQEFGRSVLPTLCIDNPERACGSLYVEGRKPSATADPQRPQR